MSAVLQLSKVTKTYGDVTALDGVDLSLPDNTYVSLLGPSGSGKTTLLRVIAGFEPQNSGTVSFRGQKIDGTPPHKRNIGFVFQNFALFPHLSVEQNIAFGLRNREAGVEGDSRTIDVKVREIIEMVGLTGLEDRAVTQISGGQRQRVALARTLVCEPDVVLLDEPLGALDANLRLRMRTELRAIRERCGVTFLHVTGSETEALAVGDMVLVLDSGHVAQAADSDTIYNRPSSPSVARILNRYNLFKGIAKEDSFQSPVGEFALDGSVRQKSAVPTYAIRFDRIEIRPAEARLGKNEVAIKGDFVASEYSGFAVTSFFSLSGGEVFEVETHLSRGKPEECVPGSQYSLVWKAEDALVYA